VVLDPGVYQYKFFGDGIELEDPQNPERVSNGVGSFNSLITIDDPDTNKLFLHVNNYKNAGDQISFSLFLEDELERNLSSNEVFALLNNSKIVKEKLDIEENLITINFNGDELKGINTLRVAVSKNGKVSNIQTINIYDAKPASNETFTWNDGIIYSLMIDRFHDGNSTNNNPVIHDSLSPKANYMGGDLKGVIDKLNEGYFDSLGVNVIWISPVYDNPNEAYKEYPAPHRYYSGYHAYRTISINKVE